MKSGLPDVLELLYLGVGDRGRLEHIKEQLQTNHTLYDSDQKYLNDLTLKYEDVMKKKSENDSQKEEIDEVKQEQSKEDKTSPHTEKFKNNFCSHCGTKINDDDFCTNCGLQTNKKITPESSPNKDIVEKKHSSHTGRNVTITVCIIAVVFFIALSLTGSEEIQDVDQTSNASLASITGGYYDDDNEIILVLKLTDGITGDTVRASGKIDVSISRNNDNSNSIYSETFTFKPADFRTTNEPMLGKVTKYLIYVENQQLGSGKYYVNTQLKLADGSTWKDLSDVFSVW